MAKERVQIVYHYSFDPAQMSIGEIEIPDQITCTVSVGDAPPVPKKVSRENLSAEDRALIKQMMEQRILSANKTAQPKDAEGGIFSEEPKAAQGASKSAKSAPKTEAPKESEQSLNLF